MGRARTNALLFRLADSASEATAKRTHTPKIAFVSRPQSYVASNGKTVDAATLDLTARILSMDQLRHAMTGTGAVAIAVAASIPGTLISRLLGGGARGEVRFSHPSGSLTVGATAGKTADGWVLTQAVMSRSARRLMDGQMFIPFE